MSKELFTNNASTTLGSAVGSGDTTITVASGTGNEFPVLGVGQYFTATMWAVGSTTGVPNEIVRVTARTGDTMTVVRGQEGSTAQAWSVGDTFANYPTAAFYNGLAQGGDIQGQTGNSATDTGTANAGVIVLNPSITALSQMLFSPIRVLKVPSVNTGAYTINVNALGAKAVTSAGQPMVAGQLLGSQLFEVFWDGTNFELISTPALIPNNQLNLMASQTVKANLTGAGANPSDVSVAALAAAIYALPPTNTTGIIYHPGGIIEQYGVDYRPGSLQGVYTTPFNIAFPNAVDSVVIATIKDNGDLGSGGDIFVQWRKAYTTLSTIAWTANDTGGSSGIAFDGMSWVAFGR